MNNKPESKIGRRDFLRAGTVIAGAAAVGPFERSVQRWFVTKGE